MDELRYKIWCHFCGYQEQYNRKWLDKRHAECQKFIFSSWDNLTEEEVLNKYLNLFNKIEV